MKMLFIIAIHALLLAGDVPQFQHLRKLMFWSVENYMLVSVFFLKENTKIDETDWESAVQNVLMSKNQGQILSN